MRFSFVRIFQWLGVAAGLFVLVGLNYDFKSEAGMRMNAPVEDPLSQGLLGYWKMDEGTGTSTTADSSGNGNTLTMTNMESGDWVAGQAGPYSLDFDGSNEYLTIASPGSVLDFPAGASFSLTGWFNRSRTYANDHTIISTKSGQSTESDGYIVWIGGSDDLLHFRADENGSTDARTIASTTTFTSAGWHHFAVSWEDNRDVSLFIDGKSEGTPSGTTFSDVGDLSNANAFRIGAETDAGVPFDGNLDDIRVYGYPLSASEVSKLYQTTAPAQPVDTGLVGHWTFDGPDIKGTTAIDRSGKGNNGTITGTTKTIGKLGQGLSCDETTGSVNVGDPVSGVFDFGAGQALTVTGWFKRRTSTNMFGLFEKFDTGSVQGMYFHLFDGTDSYIDAEVTDTGSHHCYVNTGSMGIPLNTWGHFAFVWGSGRTLTIYSNGVQVGYSSCPTVTGASSSVPLVIGGYNSDDVAQADGVLDDYRVYNRALSPAEVLDLYNLGK